jgi:hypothetical protein
MSLATTALNSTAWAADLAHTADHDYEAPMPGSYQLPILMRAADGEVLNSNGQPLRLSELTHGQVTVMSFILHASRICQCVSDGDHESAGQARQSDFERTRRRREAAGVFGPGPTTGFSNHLPAKKIRSSLTR